MNDTVIVATRTGGQGKTLIAHLLALAREIEQRPYHAVSIDTDTESALSKLGKYLQSVEEIRISPGLDRLRQNPNLVLAHWDRVGEILLTGGALIDCGANVVGNLLQWAQARRAGELLAACHPIHLVVPTRAQGQALEDALDLLQRSIDLQFHFPMYSRTLILNEASGDFTKYGTSTDFQTLARLKADHGVKVIKLPFCRCELWPNIERLYLPLATLMAKSATELAQEFQISPFEATGARADLLDWVDEALSNLAKAGLTRQLTQ